MVAVEREIRASFMAGDFRAAGTRAILAYGPEILGYLVSILSDRGRASETFATFSEDLWRGLPSFRWESTLRTWAYVLARNALRRTLAAPVHEVVPLPEDGELSALRAQVHSSAAYYLKSAFKDRFAQLRQQLTEEERSLLTMRVDRDMSWGEVAQVLGEAPTQVVIDRLKKRFERLKRQLREMAAAQGLLADEEPR